MPITVLSRQAAERLVEAATAAPSADNAQPWRFIARQQDRTIEIYADPARTLRRGDPRGRAVYVACGAALLNLRLAIAHAGAEPVARVLPDPRNPLLLAAVRIAGPYRARRGEHDLHAAIPQAGNGVRAGGRAPVRGLLAGMLEAVSLEGASLRLLDQPEALRMLQSVAAAARTHRPNAGYLPELRRFFPGAGGSQSAGANGGPQLAVISTRSDDRGGWLLAGQAMQRLLLLAAHRGVAACPLTPALELPDVPLRPDPRLADGHPEIIVRLGGDPAGLPAARRPLAQVLRLVSPARPDGAAAAAPAGAQPAEAGPATAKPAAEPDPALELTPLQ